MLSDKQKLDILIPKAQILAWLQDEHSQKELRKSYAELKKSVDRFD